MSSLSAVRIKGGVSRINNLENTGPVGSGGDYFVLRARDIFEEPNANARYTRIFLRSVDESRIALVRGGPTRTMRYAK
jgi:hypothetical protein